MLTRHEAQEDTPPTPEELAVLVQRIRDRHEGQVDVRAHGAVTVSDLAEATGASPELVRQHLERVRAEKALTHTPPKPKSQTPLLLLAGALFLVAYVIYRATPHKVTQEELEARLAEIRAKNRNKPKAVVYPIQFKVNEHRPPAGFPIEIGGPLTVTRSDPEAGARFLPWQQAEAQLADSLIAAYEAAMRNEANAPKPTKPLPPRYPWASMNDGMFMLSAGGATMQVGRALPPMTTPEAAHKSIERSMRQFAKTVIENALKAQEALLQEEPNAFNTGVAQGPPGYTIAFQGRRTNSFGGQSLKVLPVDPERAAKRLEVSIRTMMRQDLLPPTYGTPETQAADAKTPTPAWSTITYTGPTGQRSFKIPTAPSREYPTAADCLAGADRILENELNRFRHALALFNKEGRPRAE